MLIWEVVFWLILALILYSTGFFESGMNMHQIEFSSPKAFALLFILPLFQFYFIKQLKNNNQKVAIIPENIQKLMLSPISPFTLFFNYFFIRNTLVCLILTLAGPVYGTRKANGISSKSELVVCLDVSNSMNTKDISGESRIDVAKRSMNELINQLKGEKIGVAVFAGRAFVQLPLTGDYASAKLFIDEISTDMFSNQGTNIKEAIDLSVSMFSESQTGKTILLVTDGENHSENPDEILDQLKSKEIKLCVLGIGTRNGGPIPIQADQSEFGYKKDAKGKIIISRINPEFIHSIANKSDGISQITDNPFPDLRNLTNQINRKKGIDVSENPIDISAEHYQKPLFIAIINWLLWLLLPSLIKKKSHD